MTEITNNSKALQGVNSKTGAVYIQPGKTVTVDLADGEYDHVKGLDFLTVTGDAPEPSKAAKEPKPAKPVKTVLDDTPKTPAEVLAMGADTTVPFMSFRSAASKLLGDKMPAKKEEIILALEELATQP